MGAGAVLWALSVVAQGLALLVFGPGGALPEVTAPLTEMPPESGLALVVLAAGARPLTP